VIERKRQARVIGERKVDKVVGIGNYRVCGKGVLDAKESQMCLRIPKDGPGRQALEHPVDEQMMRGGGKRRQKGDAAGLEDCGLWKLAGIWDQFRAWEYLRDRRKYSRDQS
jgi:hypothetical protein